MGTIIYLLFRVLNVIDAPLDIATLCVLISLDTIGVPTALSFIMKMK